MVPNTAGWAGATHIPGAKGSPLGVISHSDALRSAGPWCHDRGVEERQASGARVLPASLREKGREWAQMGGGVSG